MFYFANLLFRLFLVFIHLSVEILHQVIDLRNLSSGFFLFLFTLVFPGLLSSSRIVSLTF